MLTSFEDGFSFLRTLRGEEECGLSPCLDSRVKGRGHGMGGVQWVTAKKFQRSRFDSRVKVVRCISSLKDTASEKLQVIYFTL